MKLDHGFGPLIEAKTQKDAQAWVNAYEHLRSLTIALMRCLLTEESVDALANAYDTLRNLTIKQTAEHVKMLYTLEDMKISGCGPGHAEEAQVIRDLVDRVCQLTDRVVELEAQDGKTISRL